MLIYGRGFSFSLAQVDMDDYGPFSGDSRIIHARSILMMIIPYLWYLSRYIQTKKLINLLLFFFCFGVILIHQHRSVWSAAIFATFVFVILTIKSNKQTASGFYNIMLISLVILALGVFYVSNLYPGFLSFMGDRFSEIFDPSKEGSTGNFRIEQTEVYGNFIRQRPVFGWSFEGFTLKNPLVDWWDENTGQHFHEGFVEILFYHGIVGLILKYSFLVTIAIKAFTQRLSQESVIMVSFCLCGLLFSLSYVLPLIFWAHVGLCLYYLERKKEAYDLHSYTGV
jgi:O-Antigen ligase